MPVKEREAKNGVMMTTNKKTRKLEEDTEGNIEEISRLDRQRETHRQIERKWVNYLGNIFWGDWRH